MTAEPAPKKTTRKKIDGKLTLLEQEFPFYLNRREVELGPAGTIQYYYMPANKLRGKDPENKVSNFRSCIGYWYAAMQENGAAKDWHQKRHYVMAIAYALVNRSKSLQKIYRDAFLYPGSYQVDELSIPEDTQQRIKQATQKRNRDEVKLLLDDALEAQNYSEEELLGFQKAYGMWVDKGVNAFDLKGQDGIIEWLQEIDGWIDQFRKRSEQRVRGFINFFSYQAKVSFYLCFANFWASLIPWLQEHHGLDEMSRRFLSLWHNQNQPQEIPHGKTQSGIIYPILAGREYHLPKEGGRTAIRYQTEQIGPSFLPDVFSGQILSLHPLSGILLKDVSLCEVVGRWISSSNFDQVQSGQQPPDHGYWDFVNAIVTSAFLYKTAREQYENRRGVAETGGDQVKALERDEATISVAVFYKQYLAESKFRCPCGGLQVLDTAVEINLQSENEDRQAIPVRCSECNAQTTIDITFQEIQSYILNE